MVVIDGVEITVEINPGKSLVHSIDTLYELGARRISVGVQSFDSDVFVLIFLIQKQLSGRIQSQKHLLSMERLQFAYDILPITYNVSKLGDSA